MRICIAGNMPTFVSDKLIEYKHLLMLQSYFDYRSGGAKVLEQFKTIYDASHFFILDSGAFSFMNQGIKDIDWFDYTKKYAQLINKFEIKNFIELDIDSIVGIKKVEELRDFLYKETGVQPIPVWHKERGLKYWEKMIKEYDFVAIGASGTNDAMWTRTKEGTLALNKLVYQAKQHNCKVHGLGYTSLKNIDSIGWYSVDSTSWLSAVKYPTGLHIFQNGKLIKYPQPKGTHSNHKKTWIHQLTEWNKLQNYYLTK